MKSNAIKFLFELNKKLNTELPALLWWFQCQGAWSEISRGAAVKHFVVAALYFLRGLLCSIFQVGGGLLWHFLLGLLRHNLAPSGELLHSIFEEDCRLFTAYFEAAFFRGSCFVAFFGGGCFANFLGGAALWHFGGGPGATAPLAPYKNHHCSFGKMTKSRLR